MNETVYAVEDEENGLVFTVITWPTTTSNYRVVIYDVDAGQRVPDLYKAFKHLSDAEAYADTCADSY